MIRAEIILKYFPELTGRQQEQLEALDALYHDWNAKINVISRKDIDQLYEHHVLHSLAIAKTIRFRPGTRILDFGTGGGFPGIPLAILFPECEFKLIEEHPEDLPDYQLTERYMQELERSIRRDPALWLWSHDRWSRTKEEFDYRFYTKDGKVYEKVTEEEYAQHKGWRSYWKH